MGIIGKPALHVERRPLKDLEELALNGFLGDGSRHGAVIGQLALSEAHPIEEIGLVRWQA